jgi:hypothetical protein
MQSFLDKLIDWKDFEKFVAELYKDSDELTVKHNVTEVGKSNAKRQIDVLVLQKTKLHTIKTIIECKRWKDPVDRHVIDVLFASVEDLNANKGAIFTTKGYEEGAIEYAKSKNIDIFIVRDIYENEWGEPGRNISLYLQTFHSMIDGLSIDNPKFFSPLGQIPSNIALNLAIHFSDKQVYPEHLNLVSQIEPTNGPNFVKLLIDVRNHILKQLLEKFNGLMQNEKPEVAYETRVKLDFTNYPFRFFKHETGFITFDSISFNHHQSISQTKIDFDRAASADFALIVENYITNQKNFAIKQKDEEQVKLSDPIEPKPAISEDKILKNGSIIKISLEHYVGYSLQPTTKITKTTDMIISLQASTNIPS